MPRTVTRIRQRITRARHRRAEERKRPRSATTVSRVQNARFPDARADKGKPVSATGIRRPPACLLGALSPSLPPALTDFPPRENARVSLSRSARARNFAFALTASVSRDCRACRAEEHQHQHQTNINYRGNAPTRARAKARDEDTKRELIDRRRLAADEWWLFRGERWRARARAKHVSVLEEIRYQWGQWCRVAARYVSSGFIPAPTNLRPIKRD